jgi:uncharacterized protein (TIGR02117 family)
VKQLLCGWLMACVLAGCTATPRTPVPIGNATIYVVGRGWHTDIGLPVDEIASMPLAILQQDFPGARVLVFGFGERNYLMAHDAGSAEMLTALFPSKSAILMTALRTSPEEAFTAEQVVTLHVTQQSVDRIAMRIWQTIEKQPDASVRPLAEGPYPGSVFYGATETYDAFHTCNTWTALVLQDAGLPVDPSGVLFADQVMHQARQILPLPLREGDGGRGLPPPQINKAAPSH